MEQFWNDLRYSLRTLALNRGFTVVAAVVLALGIGANTAVFSVVNSVLLRPLPYRDPSRLVVALHDGQYPVSPADFLDYQQGAPAFEQMGAAQAWSGNLRGPELTEVIPGLQVTANLIPLLGIQPMLGRTFGVQDEQPDAQRPLLLSYHLWQRRFGGKAETVGHSIALDGVPYIVIGVMPPAFRFAPFWAAQAEMWTPLQLQNRLNDRAGRSLRVFARLRHGVSINQAQTEMDTIALRLAADYPKTNDQLSITVVPLHEKVVGPIRPTLLILLGMVGFVLLIACANVANLVLTRAASRRKEFALRLALGAGRWRLIRQMITEGLLLSSAGGIAGSALAWWSLQLLTAALPKDSLPRQQEVGIDLAVLAFTVIISLLTGLIAGILPAMQAVKTDLNESLKEGGRGSSDGRGRSRIRSALVIAEFALSLVLLVGAGLMIETMQRLYSVDPGFNPDRLLTLQVSLAGTPYDATPEKRAALFHQVNDRLAALPGVSSASAINHLPLAGDVWTFGYRVEGRPAPLAGEGAGAVYRVVRSGYFETMQMPLLRGRTITDRDNGGSPAVVIINQALANRQWPKEDPLGKRIFISDEGPFNIAGVVKDARQGAWAGQPGDEVYLPYLQRPNAFGLTSLTFVVRTGIAPESAIRLVEREVASIDKDLPVSNVTTMKRVIDDKLWRVRVSTILLSVFAAIALLLAAVGIYGVISYSVRQRTHEIGIRIALGAAQGDVIRSTLVESMKPALVGTFAGLLFAGAATRLMKSLLFGISAFDPSTFAAVTILLLLTAVLAAFLPALRAARVDPMVALRHD